MQAQFVEFKAERLATIDGHYFLKVSHCMLAGRAMWFPEIYDAEGERRDVGEASVLVSRAQASGLEMLKQWSETA